MTNLWLEHILFGHGPSRKHDVLIWDFDPTIQQELDENN